MLPVVVSFPPLFEPFPNVIFNIPQMPVNTGAPLFIRSTWPHWEGGVGANSPL